MSAFRWSMNYMEEKRITIDNFQNQTMAFGIEEYDEHIEIGRFLSNDIGQVEIPERIHGKPVTVIGDDCFFGCNNIKLIKLPNSITLIGAQAFAMCKNLNEITLIFMNFCVDGKFNEMYI